jgi:hypothetical protein
MKGLVGCLPFNVNSNKQAKGTEEGQQIIRLSSRYADFAIYTCTVQLRFFPHITYGECSGWGWDGFAIQKTVIGMYRRIYCSGFIDFSAMKKK